MRRQSQADRVLGFVLQKGGVRHPRIADALGIPRPSARRAVYELVKRGEVVVRDNLVIAAERRKVIRPSYVFALESADFHIDGIILP